MTTAAPGPDGPGLGGPGLGGVLSAAARPQLVGRVERIGQAEADVVGLRVGPGDLVELGAGGPGPPLLAEVVAVDGGRATVLAYGDFRGHRVGDPVEPVGGQLEVPVGSELLGRVLDGLARPIDDGPSLRRLPSVTVHNAPPSALSRPAVVEPMPVAVRAIDTLLTCGRGQRIAIMAGSGVGKSSLLSMLVRGSGADVNVLCLVGERGPRGPPVPRRRPRTGRPGPQRGRRGHVRPAGAGPAQRGLRRHPDRRALPGTRGPASTC